MEAPLFDDVGVLAFVPDRWDRPGAIWMPREQVLIRMARYFHTLWVNPARGWREIVRKAGRRAENINSVPKVPGFSIYEPGPWLPRMHKPRLLSEFTEMLRLRQASRILTQKGCVKSVLYIWRPIFGHVLDCLKYDYSAYHIDDEYSFSKQETPISDVERRVITRVDQVIVHSPALLEKKGGINPNTSFVPNGVDYDLYSTPADEPSDMRHIPHPRVGYVGNVKNQLDLELLLELATRHKSWSFVFVGPTVQLKGNETFNRLAAQKNVYFLGPKTLNELPAYTQHQDVCILCYRVDDYTKYIFPLKLHEYLATGRPVVGSPIQTLLHFRDVIRLASTADEWSSALMDALKPDACAGDQVARRKLVARQYDWEALVRSIVRSMCAGLGNTYLQRFAQLSGDSDIWTHSRFR
jgi:glycosyltransferase involved in cell wall biosynthesis